MELIELALIEADHKLKTRVNCSGAEDGIVTLAREYRNIKSKLAALQEYESGKKESA